MKTRHRARVIEYSMLAGLLVVAATATMNKLGVNVALLFERAAVSVSPEQTGMAMRPS